MRVATVFPEWDPDWIKLFPATFQIFLVVASTDMLPLGICLELFLNFWKKPRTFSILVRFFFLFVNVGPYGRKTVKMLLLLQHVQIAAKCFQLLLNLKFLLIVTVPTNPLLGFWYFENWHFSDFYSLFINMGLKISKRYSYKSQQAAYEPFLNFPPNGPHKTTLKV